MEQQKNKAKKRAIRVEVPDAIVELKQSTIIKFDVVIEKALTLAVERAYDELYQFVEQHKEERKKRLEALPITQRQRYHLNIAANKRYYRKNRNKILTKARQKRKLQRQLQKQQKDT